MHETANLVLRGAGALVALSLLYVAFFLYEDEQSVVHDRIEALWGKVNDGSGSKSAMLFQGVARFANRGFDRVFGPHALSLQFLVTSFCFVLSSVTLLFPTLGGLGGSESYPLNMKDAVWFVLLAFIGLLPAFFQKKWALLVASVPLLGFVVMIVMMMIIAPKQRWNSYPTFFLGGMIAGIGATALMVTISRIVLKRIAGVSAALMFCALNAVFLVAFVWPLRFWSPNAPEPFPNWGLGQALVVFLQFSALSNFIPALIAILNFSLIAIVLAHPLTGR